MLILKKTVFTWEIEKEGWEGRGQTETGEAVKYET